MAEFNPQIGTSLKLLWNMSGNEGLSGSYDPPIAFNTGTMEGLFRRISRVHFDLADYLNDMSAITALAIDTAETKKRHIKLVGSPENEAWRPASLMVHLAPDDAGTVLGCDIAAMPRPTRYQRPAAGLHIARVPLAVLAAEAAGNMTEEQYNEAGLPDVKLLVDAVGGLVIKAMLRSDGPGSPGEGSQHA